jgi:hypothetical protein
MLRWTSSQLTSGSGQEIFPVMLPLTERFVSEQATAYNRAVRRRFVDEEGNETEATKKQTLEFNRAAEKARYDEVLHANDQMTVLLKTSCLLPQKKRKQLKMTIRYPYTVYPVAPEKPIDRDGGHFDVSDPDDYEGFVLEFDHAQEDMSKASTQKGYVYLANDGQRVFYKGSNPYTVSETSKMSASSTSFVHNDKEGDEVDEPGRMLTFWHNALTPDELIVQTDVSIAKLNRELDILFAVLMDTMRFQGHATPVINTADPNNFPAKQRWGSRFPIVMGPKEAGEEFQYATADAPYEESVKFLLSIAQFAMLLLRSSPSDFSLEGQKAISGFAKLVDSLPRLEARSERVRALTWLEENELSPRTVAIMVETGDLDPEAKQMRLITEFEDIQFPLSPDERAKELETNFKYNLTTAAKELAEQKGISIEDAEKEIEQNKEQNGTGKPEGDLFEKALTARVARKGNGDQEQPDRGEPPRPDRQPGGDEERGFGGPPGSQAGA